MSYTLIPGFLAHAIRRVLHFIACIGPSPWSQYVAILCESTVYVKAEIVHSKGEPELIHMYLASSNILKKLTKQPYVKTKGKQPTNGI